MPSSRSSSSYSIVEPHPSTKRFIPVGRGGAGNIHRVPSSVTRGSDASGPASISSHITTSSPNSSRAFSTGRGGAGNLKQPPSERAIFSFDEELERQLSQERHAAPVYHVGRGGAGNVHGRRVSGFGEMERRKSDDTGSEDSVRSVESGADVATRAMKKGWAKITGVY